MRMMRTTQEVGPTVDGKEWAFEWGLETILNDKDLSNGFYNETMLGLIGNVAVGSSEMTCALDWLAQNVQEQLPKGSKLEFRFFTGYLVDHRLGGPTVIVAAYRDSSGELFYSRVFDATTAAANPTVALQLLQDSFGLPSKSEHYPGVAKILQAKLGDPVGEVIEGRADRLHHHALAGTDRFSHGDLFDRILPDGGEMHFRLVTVRNPGGGGGGMALGDVMSGAIQQPWVRAWFNESGIV